MVAVTHTKYISLHSGSDIFYREAGSKTNKTILLLHGFPTSSFMFRNLIPLISDKFHVVAPDLPGFGFTTVPSGYKYSFNSAADTIDEFVKALDLKKFAIYVFDYGSPTGLRLALKDPPRVTGLVIQNGAAYEEALAKEFWSPLVKYWETNDRHNEKYVTALSEFLADQNSISDQYSVGFKDGVPVDPTPIALDGSFVSKPGYIDTQLDYFFDYGNNLKLYSSFQEFFRTSGIPALVIWGKNDYIFTVEGAEAYKRDIKDITYHYVDSGHFALESHFEEFAQAINKFSAKLKQ